MFVHQALLTLSLKKENYFTSSYNGFLIFGSVSQEQYQSFLKFYHFELHIFYQTLRSIVEYLTNKEKQSVQKTLIKHDEGLKYYWLGENNKQTNVKSIQFLIEIEQNTSFFWVNEKFIESLLISLKYTYLSCTNLLPNQKFFLREISQKSMQEIKRIKEDLKLFQNIYLSFAEFDEKAKSQIFENFQILQYYYEDIKILCQINMLS